MAAQWATDEEQRATAFGVMVEQLADRGELRLPAAQAVDVVCAVHSIELFQILRARGWSAEQWERLVVETLDHALLR